MRLRHLWTILGVLCACSSAAESQTPPGQLSREFPFPATAVKQALIDLGAYTGARLPQLEGFVYTERGKLQGFENPYYEFKLQLEPLAATRSLVSARASISAWHKDPETQEGAYQAFVSNGRLERELLERLNDFLNGHKLSLPGDPVSLQSQIDQLKRQENETSARIKELQEQLPKLKTALPGADSPELVLVTKNSIPVLRAPEAGAAAVLQAQAEDEFLVLEQRGAWVQLQLRGPEVGWVRRSDIQLAPPLPPDKAEPHLKPSLSVVHEVITDFNGDWSQLKGKKAIYLWARSDPGIPVASAEKLRFLESAFADRYRIATHNSALKAAGIVLIFLDPRGGVAAATMKDIAAWLNGSFTQPEFLNKCSLDPASAFTSSARRH